MPGLTREDEDVVDRVLLVTQLIPTVTADVIKTAFSQLGLVRKVVVVKDPLNPAVNMMTWAGATALVEMESSDFVQKVIEEAETMLFIVGMGPRAVRAQRASLAMLDPSDWPEAFLSERANQERVRPTLMDMSDAGTTGGGGSDEQGARLAAMESVEDWEQRKGLVQCHVEECRLLQEGLLLEHKELHESQHKLLERELQKWKLMTENIDREEGAVRALAKYYGVHWKDNLEY